MKIGDFNTEESVFIIAEIGNNHEGNFDFACEMVVSAAKTGVNAVKFQSIVPENLVTIDQSDRIKQLNRFHLSKEQYIRLAEIAKENGVHFMSTPFDLEMVDFLNDLVPAFKISSGDNNYFRLLEKVAETGKPIIMSSGMTDRNEVERSRDFIFNSWEKNQIKNGDLAILHCVSSYPTMPEDAQLSRIKELLNLKCEIGYSDHTIGINAAALSVAFGARIIEKHFTLDNDYSDFRDHKLSANPDTMKELVSTVREAEKMVGDVTIGLSENEMNTKSQARRSAAIARDIKEGEILSSNDLTWLRPGDGIPPEKEHEIIGKKAKKDLRKGFQLKIEDLA